MKRTLTSLAAIACLSAFSIPFENVKFYQNIDTQSMETVSQTIGSTNGVTTIGKITYGAGGTLPSQLGNLNGITFDIYDDGDLKFFFNEMEDGTDPMDKIFVNDRTLGQIVQEKVEAGVQATQYQVASNTFVQLMNNPLWGKKLAVIGDSLTGGSSKTTSYPYYIAQRNNMVLVHNGRSGQRLCTDRTNELGQVTIKRLLTTYTNDIPVDADFILCQIGTNDAGDWWARDENLEIPDSDMTTNTFKGCWNNLLLGLKTKYPNAKIGMIMAHCWADNYGKNSEETISESTTRRMSQWQKIQCQKLNIPVFDPVEDTRMVVHGQTIYPAAQSTPVDSLELDWYDSMKRQMGTDHVRYDTNNGRYIFPTTYFYDSIHPSPQGHLLLSFFYEQWMKTVLMAN